MTKRYREALDAVAVDEATPVSFRWRGQTYRVLAVLGHWREDPGWWRRSDGQPIRIDQTDLWRVEAVDSGFAHSLNGVPSSRGVYELVHRDEHWTLDRIWD